MKLIKAESSDVSAHLFEFEIEKTGVSEIIWVADLHGDSDRSCFDFFKQILKIYPNAMIIVGGDHLDVMQNRGDKRASKSALKNEFKEDDYLNQIIDYNVEIWGKYADRILAFFIGNHELTQVKFYGMDLTKEIVKRINEKHGTNILIGDLQGWMKWRFSLKGRRFAYNVFYQHVPETGGKRSKGMLSVDITKGKYPDADIYISEHIHNTWMKPERIENFDNNGKVLYRNKWFVQMPTLKDEHKKAKRRGYVHLRNYGSVPIGVVVFEIRAFNQKVKLPNPKYELMD